MTSLDLPAATARMLAAAVAEKADSVTIDIHEPVHGAVADETCVSEMSFCDLAGSVAPSDSASQVFSPRGAGPMATCRNFDALHAVLGSDDSAFMAWKQVCEREEAAARAQGQHDRLVQRLLQQHEEMEACAEADSGKKMDKPGMRHLIQTVDRIERSLEHLHSHFGTNLPVGRGQGQRRSAEQPVGGGTPDAPQSFQSNTNINAPNMNRQHATGGRGRGRRQPNVA